MLTEDHLIRMINQLIMVITRLLRLKSAGQYMEAFITIDQTIGELFGLKAEIVRRMNERAIIDALSYQGNPDPYRILFYAELLKEEGDLYALMENAENSISSYQQALYYYITAVLEGPVHQDAPDPHEKIAVLLQRLEPIGIPEDTLIPLFQYYETLKNFQAAEKILEQLEQYPGWSHDVKNEWGNFFRRMLLMSDQEIERSGYTRNIITEKLEKNGQ